MKIERYPNNALVRIDVSHLEKITPADQEKILRLFDDPTQTVVVRGLHQNLDERFMKWDYIAKKCGNTIYRQFKCFKRDISSSSSSSTSRSDSESDIFLEAGTMAMSFATYDQYLRRRRDALMRRRRTEGEDEEEKEKENGRFTTKPLESVEDIMIQDDWLKEFVIDRYYHWNQGRLWGRENKMEENEEKNGEDVDERDYVGGESKTKRK